jgi:hypothetical protein
MKPIRFLLILLFLFNTFQFSSAQNLPDYADEEKEQFNDLFSTSNVGVLHVYAASKKQVPSDYFFKGQKIPTSFYQFFTQNWIVDMPDGFEAYALHRIRGRGGDLYLIRFEGDGVQHLIELFQFNEEKLVHKQVLANYQCADQLCIQQDAWITDVNNDVRLDIIKKVKIFTDNGVKNRFFPDEYRTMLTQQADGSFTPTEEPSIDWTDYKFDSLSEE